MVHYKRRPSLKTLLTSYEDCPVEISKEQYLEITEGFMKFLMDKIIAGERVKLPNGMGEMRVIGRKSNMRVIDGQIYGLPPDWKKTLELWDRDPEAKANKEIIYHFNENTNGIKYKFEWVKKIIPIPFWERKPYIFVASRNNKRRVWKKITEGHEYLVQPPYNYTNARITQLINQKKALTENNEIHENG